VRGLSLVIVVNLELKVQPVSKIHALTQFGGGGVAEFNFSTFQFYIDFKTAYDSVKITN
jgi:hypothetical protein